MLNRLKGYLYFQARKACYIGFLNECYLPLPSDERFEKISWLELGGYNDGWFADPFFLTHEDSHIQILVEEYVYRVKKGRISMLDIALEGGKYVLEKVTPLLDIDTHISYPAIFRINENIYVYPENFASGKLNVYKFNSDIQSLDYVGVLIDKPLVDTSIFQYNGKYYAMGTLNEGDPYEATRFCEVFTSDSFFGPYTHIQTIENPRKEERGAGDIFINDKGEMIRPAQNNQVSYGKSLVMYRLDFSEDGLVKEILVNRYEPDYSKRYGLFLHTFNCSNGLCVIDGYDYVHPNYAKYYEKLHNKWKTVFKK